MSNHPSTLQEQEEQDTCDLRAASLPSPSTHVNNRHSRRKRALQQARTVRTLPAARPSANTGPNSASSGDEGKEHERVAANLEALHQAGIREPTAGRLARLPHVHPEYITAHVELANSQGHSLGTAIHRIEHAWGLPAAKTVPTVADKIDRFLSQQWRSAGPTLYEDDPTEGSDNPPNDPESHHD